MTHPELWALFGALSNPDRLAIVNLLSCSQTHRAGGLMISRIAGEAGISRFAASRHLKMLRASGLVASREVGRATVYRLDDSALTRLDDWLINMLDSVGASDPIDA